MRGRRRVGNPALVMIKKLETKMSKAGQEDESVPFASNEICIFYKLISASILQDNKLKIPRKFVKKYGDDLSTNAMLIAPSGCMWPVELRVVDRDLWFDDGWEEFVGFYSIRVGHFLVFEYEKRSIFKVYIYYLPLFETNYPCALPEGLQHPGCASPSPESSRQCVADDGFVEMPGVGNDSRARHPPFDETGRRTRRIAELDHQARWRSEAKLPRIGKSSPAQMRKCRQVTGAEMDRMIRAIDNIKPDHPFFMLIMQPSYVHGKAPMHIPTSFSKVHLRSSTVSDITLQVSDVQQWRVRCVRCVPFSQGVKFSQGWAEFAHDNNLEPGDACVFELIDTKDVRMRVHIFRVRGDEDQPANRLLA